MKPYQMILFPAEQSAAADSTATYEVCPRNSMLGASFHDKSSFLRSVDIPQANNTILVIADSAYSRNEVRQSALVQHLREGEPVPGQLLRTDWIIIVLVFAAFLLTIIRSGKQGMHAVLRFFLFRGINDSEMRDTIGIFQWQTTLLNLISFLVISLFLYQAAAISDSVPAGFPGLAAWAVCLAAIILALTLRHIVCLAIGIVSGRREVFNEYLVGIYQSYHFTAVALAVLVILLSYTSLIPPGFFLPAGLAVFGIMYLFRVTRLLLIFLNRNISIFYLILYLCALEILPAAVIIRYFSGLA